MNRRKEIILKALEIKANAVLDAYFHQTKAKIPQTFRTGLRFTIEDPPATPSNRSTPAPNEKQGDDEGIAVEAPQTDSVKESEEVPDLTVTSKVTIHFLHLNSHLI